MVVCVCVCTSSKLALEFWSISIDSDRPVSCRANRNLMLPFDTTLLLCTAAQMMHHTPQHQQQTPPNVPRSCRCLLPPAPCALIHRRARRWGSAGAAGGSQKLGHRGKSACTCRCCGKRRRDGWARRRAGPGWRTPPARFHSQAPLQRWREDLNNSMRGSPSQIS